MELKANELKLNNIVGRGFMNPAPTGLKKEYEPCEIKSLGIERIIVNSKINSNELIKMSYDNIKPIPLTEELLLKCNFNFRNFGYEFSVSYHLLSGNFYFMISGFGKQIYYLHELQNLYFSLTNKELEIKM